METSLTTTLDYGPFRVGGAVVRPRFHFTHDSPEAPRVCGQVVCGGRPGLSPALTPSHSGVSPGPPPSQARGHVPGDWAPGGSRHDSPFLKGATTRKRPRMQVTPRQGEMPSRLKRACSSETEGNEALGRPLGRPALPCTFAQPAGPATMTRKLFREPHTSPDTVRSPVLSSSPQRLH